MPVGKMFSNILPSCFAACCMLLVFLLPQTDKTWLNIAYAGIAAAIYFVVIMLFREERQTLLNLPNIIKNR